MTKIGLIAASVLIATTAAASAHGSSVDSRQAWQAKRIEAGRQNGSITWFEGLKLRAEQKRIARLEAIFRADGHLSVRERRKLRRFQNDAAKHIVAERRDSWRRATWMPHFGR